MWTARGGGAPHVFISLSLLYSGIWVRLGAGGEDRAREGLGRGCDTPGQKVLENHKRRFYFLQRIQLVWTCTTALRMVQRTEPLLEYESCPGTLAIVAPRGTT